MKKNILILLGLSLSLMAGADIQQEWHELGNVTADPFTCQYDMVVKSTLTKPAYTAYYYYYEGMRTEEPFATQKDSVVLSERGGCYTVIVAAGNIPVVNSPERQAATPVIPADELPIPSDFYVEKYDIYNVCIFHPMIEHWDTLNADLVTGGADYELYSTYGGSEGGKNYCKSDANLFEIYKDFTYKATGKMSDLPYALQQLTPGDYVYYVNVGLQAINTPVRKAINAQNPFPGSMSLNDVWTDKFYIHVNRVTCQDNLVYTKWTDVLFVDNGGYSSKFERGDFVAYQWWNEGKMIEGETDQWMRTQGTPTGRYYAEITTKNGKKVFTCPCKFDALPKSEAENPHTSQEKKVEKRLVNGQLLILRDGNTYNAQGTRL